MPVMTQTYSNQLEKMLKSSNKLFASLFNDERISRREQDWLVFDNLIKTASERNKLLKQRLENIKIICEMAWTEPWHITGSMPRYRNFNTIEDAIAAYPKAYYDYTTRLAKYSIGNLVVQVEIGYNLEEGEPKFNLHFHALLEKVGYDHFLRHTEHYRRGRKPNSWQFYSKHNPRSIVGKYKDQSSKDYLFSQARYLTKFSILQGDTRKQDTGHASQALPNQSDFAEKLLKLRLENPILIRRIVISSKFALSDTCFWLSNQISKLSSLITRLRLFSRLFSRLAKNYFPDTQSSLLKLARQVLGLLKSKFTVVLAPRHQTTEEVYLMDAVSD